MARFRRIKQPPIDRMGRPSEFRPRWWGLGLMVVAIALVVVGFLYKHVIADTAAGKYNENWLIQSVITPDDHSIYATPAAGPGTLASTTGPGVLPAKPKGKNVCVT